MWSRLTRLEGGGLGRCIGSSTSRRNVVRRCALLIRCCHLRPGKRRRKVTVWTGKTHCPSNCKLTLLPEREASTDVGSCRPVTKSGICPSRVTPCFFVFVAANNRSPGMQRPSQTPNCKPVRVRTVPARVFNACFGVPPKSSQLRPLPGRCLNRDIPRRQWSDVDAWLSQITPVADAVFIFHAPPLTMHRQGLPTSAVAALHAWRQLMPRPRGPFDGFVGPARREGLRFEKAPLALKLGCTARHGAHLSISGDPSTRSCKRAESGSSTRQPLISGQRAMPSLAGPWGGREEGAR